MGEILVRKLNNDIEVLTKKNLTYPTEEIFDFISIGDTEEHVALNSIPDLEKITHFLNSDMMITDILSALNSTPKSVLELLLHNINVKLENNLVEEQEYNLEMPFTSDGRIWFKTLKYKKPLRVKPFAYWDDIKELNVSKDNQKFRYTILNAYDGMIIKATCENITKCYIIDNKYLYEIKDGAYIKEYFKLYKQNIIPKEIFIKTIKKSIL